MGKLYYLEDFRALPPCWTFQAQPSPSGHCPTCSQPSALATTRRAWQEPVALLCTASEGQLLSAQTVYVQCRCRQVYWWQPAQN